MLARPGRCPDERSVIRHLIGNTGIARRVVLDRALDKAVARKAKDGATAQKMPMSS